MSGNKPISRSEALQPLSREHHDGLLFSWKIRKGFAMGVAVERMKQYADWFYKNHLKEHFEIEEKHLFPLLGNEHRHVQEAVRQHRQLEQLFAIDHDYESSLPIIADELQEHIRFEERVLFNEIQDAVPELELNKVEKLTEAHSCGNWEDEFWK